MSNESIRDQIRKDIEETAQYLGNWIYDDTQRMNAAIQLEQVIETRKLREVIESLKTVKK